MVCDQRKIQGCHCSFTLLSPVLRSQGLNICEYTVLSFSSEDQHVTNTLKEVKDPFKCLPALSGSKQRTITQFAQLDSSNIGVLAWLFLSLLMKANKGNYCQTQTIKTEHQLTLQDFTQGCYQDSSYGLWMHAAFKRKLEDQNESYGTRGSFKVYFKNSKQHSFTFTVLPWGFEIKQHCHQISNKTWKCCH